MDRVNLFHVGCFIVGGADKESLQLLQFQRVMAAGEGCAAAHQEQAGSRRRADGKRLGFGGPRAEGQGWRAEVWRYYFSRISEISNDWDSSDHSSITS